MSWTLIEACAGSAALTMHLLGAQRQLVPYQGSKWRFRRELRQLAAQMGFEGPPECVILTDPGPWANTLKVVLDPELRAWVVIMLETWVSDPKGVYDALQGRKVSTDPSLAAAEHLFLQRLAFSGKAVGIAKGRWSAPGFNKTSAFGTPATERFGEVKPMIPSLIKVLEGYDTQLASIPVSVYRRNAQDLSVASSRTLVYIDPPYVDTTPYPNGDLSRYDVIELAKAWRDVGAAVMVSEQHWVPIEGRWWHTQLGLGANGDSPFRGKHPEWVTWSTPSEL